MSLSLNDFAPTKTPSSSLSLDDFTPKANSTSIPLAKDTQVKQLVANTAPPVDTSSFFAKSSKIFKDIISLPGKAIQGAGNLLEKTYGKNIEAGLAETPEIGAEKVLKPAAALVGRASPENLPFGVGATIAGYKDIYNHPTDYTPVTMKDVLGGIVGASKDFLKIPFRAATNFKGTPMKFNVPVLGEITNRQFNAAQRIQNGEDPVAVTTDEGIGSIFDTLMLVGMVSEVVGPRQVVTQSGEMTQEEASNNPNIKNAPTGAKSFRLFDPINQAQPVSPGTIARMINEKGFNPGKDFDPTLPTYFKGSGTSGGNIKFEVVQIKPSYLNQFLNMFPKSPGTAITTTESNLPVTTPETLSPIPIKEFDKIPEKETTTLITKTVDPTEIAKAKNEAPQPKEIHPTLAKEAAGHIATHGEDLTHQALVDNLKLPPAQAREVIQNVKQSNPQNPETVLSKVINQGLQTEPKSRFATPEELIRTVEQRGSGTGFKLNTTEIKQLFTHLVSQGEDNKTIQTWGGTAERGTVYKPYGYNNDKEPDLILGKVTDPRFGGQSMIVAQLDKNGVPTGYFRTHATHIPEKDIITKLGDKGILGLPEGRGFGNAKPTSSSNLSKFQLSDKVKEHINYHNDVIANIKEQLDEHPGKVIQHFSSKKEGQFEDFKNPKLAKTPGEAKRITERNTKAMNAIENAMAGTKYEGQFDNVDSAREAIEEYKNMQGSMQFHKEQLANAKKGILPEGKSIISDNTLKLDEDLLGKDAFNEQGGFVNLDALIKDLKTKLETVKQGKEDAKMGEALRGYFIGERDARIAETNQFRDELQKQLKPFEQEAITFYRDFKGKETQLADLLNNKDFAPYKKVIELAIKPTEAMLSADKKITEFTTKIRKEEERLEILQSSIDNEKYITHLLSPSETIHGKEAKISRAKISRRDPFAKGRKYETVADAISAGVKVRSLNALDALTIRGEKWGIAVATKLMENQLKDSAIGKNGFKDAENIPKEWVEADPSGKYFRNNIPFINKEGKPSVAYQNLYVPPVVADALKALITSDFTGQIPGFSQGRVYQAYLKGIQLSLSVFHMKALNITALNNEGLTGLVKSYQKNMTSPEFLEAEKYWIKRGLTTSILGRTREAYKGLENTSIPSRSKILKNLPIIKQMDQVAKGLTKVTFDIMQRKFKVTDASLQGTQWKLKHPFASPSEISDAERSIAKQINSTYGGLNWEIMGWNKGVVNLNRFLLLAPDWTYSNWLNAKYAFEGGPAGSASRKFWIRSIITGAILTYLTSVLINGKAEKANFQNFTSVHLGTDKNGKEIYQNMFFAGAPSDAINTINNIADYGIIQGFANEIAAKSSPLARAGVNLYTNKNYLGQDIVPKGMGLIAGTTRTAYMTALTLLPVPFSLSNLTQMFTDPNKQFTLAEYATTLTGSRPRHITPEGMKVIPSGPNKGQVVPDTNIREQNSLLVQILTGNIYKKGSANLTNILQGSNSNVIDEINRLNATNTPPSGTDIETRPDVQIFKAEVTPAKYTEAMGQFKGTFVSNMAKLLDNKFLKPATSTSIARLMDYTNATDDQKSKMVDIVRNNTLNTILKAYHYNKGTGVTGKAIFEGQTTKYGNPTIENLSNKTSDDGTIEGKNPKGEPIYKRFPLSESGKIHNELYNQDPYWKDNGYTKDDTQLDHIVPIEAGGTMSKNNLMLISKLSDQLNQPFEDFLGAKYAAGTISRANAIKASIDYKINKSVTLNDIKNGKY